MLLLLSGLITLMLVSSFPQKSNMYIFTVLILLNGLVLIVSSACTLCISSIYLHLCYSHFNCYSILKIVLEKCVHIVQCVQETDKVIIVKKVFYGGCWNKNRDNKIDVKVEVTISKILYGHSIKFFCFFFCQGIKPKLLQHKKY